MCLIFRQMTFFRTKSCGKQVMATTPPQNQGQEAFDKYDIPLYVSEASIEAYKNTSPWNKFKEILKMEEGDDPGTLKCAKPTITFSNEQILFGCETEGVEFHYTISSSDAKSGIATQSVALTHKYTVSVYATKEGYENSETATAELTIKNGDMNGDGVITVTDTILLLDEVLTKP